MKKIIFIFCVLFSVLGEAQTWTRYNSATTSTQLPNNSVGKIIQDKDSSIWFLTGNGVSNLKGKTWKNYFETDGLLSNNPRSIAIDLFGNKWIVSDNGVSKFDGTKWKNYQVTEGLASNSVSSIAIDKLGKKWFTTWDKGISVFNDTTWINYSSSDGLASDIVWDIAIDSIGNKWIATNNGLSKFDGSKWLNYLTGYPILCISIDIKGNVWVGMFNNGVAKFDGTTWTSYKKDNGLADNDITSISSDKQGNIWIGTKYYGISKFDGTNWKTFNSTNGLASNYVFSSFIDSNGNKWIGTDNGVSKFDNINWTTYSTKSGLKNDVINSIVIDEQNNKWIGTNAGIVRFDGTNWTTYTSDSGLVNNVVTSIAIDVDGNKWIGTKNGVSKFDGSKWENFTTNDGLGGNDIKSILIDIKGDKWFELMGGGISKFDGKNWTSYIRFNGDSNSYFKSITEDIFGNKWFIIGHEGSILSIVKYDGTNWIANKSGLGLFNPINKITPMTFDSKESLWIGVDYPIKINALKEVVYNASDLGAGNIFSITTDQANVKWFSTNGGISKYDDKQWINYNWYSKGLAFLENAKTIAIDKNGNKWIGTDWSGITMMSDGGADYFDKVKNVQRGTIFHDQNANGKKDPNETNISGQIVKIDNNYTTTQNNGLFYTSLNTGSHTFTYRPQANWKLTTDSSITVTVSDSPIKDTLYFGVQAIVNKHEVKTKLTGTATRTGFQNKSWINYTNLGTLAENGTVSYTIADEASLVQTIPMADSLIGKRLVWKYANLIPNEQRQISITTQMPGVNYLGDTLVSIAKIKSVFRENSDTLKQVLTGSYDPNDKLVAQGIGSKGYVLFGKELEYTVRFQNTGTDTAFNVNIRDTLDLNLDVASLQIVASSHPVKLDLRGQNEATFRFENIKLPYQKIDTLGSNGFLKYTIRPQKNLAENTLVKNKAYIYFDFNPAIITNETMNTYVSKLPSPTGIDHFGFQSNKSASIFPNPAKDEFTIVFPQTGTYEVSLANIQGKNIRTWNEFQGIETTLSLDGVEPGLYLYTAQSRNGQKYMGKVVVR